MSGERWTYILKALSRNRHTSPYMRWYWRHLPEVQPVDIVTPLGRIKWIVRDGDFRVCDFCALEASPAELEGVDQQVPRPPQEGEGSRVRAEAQQVPCRWCGAVGGAPSNLLPGEPTTKPEEDT